MRIDHPQYAFFNWEECRTGVKDIAERANNQLLPLERFEAPRPLHGPQTTHGRRHER